MAEYTVVGAGFAGATCARRLADAGHQVRVVEQRPHVAGNAFDFRAADGLLIHTYGPHIFHTNAPEVFHFLSRFTEWRRYEHRVLAQAPDGHFVPFPINRTTVQHFGSESAARAALIEPYTQKQWGPYAAELDPSVLARVKPRHSFDDRYFTDTYQVMPVDGYTALVTRMLEHPGITVQLGKRWQDVQHEVGVREHVIFTGPLDEYFGYAFGRLPYRSAMFRHLSGPPMEGLTLPAPVVNVPNARVEYTRLTDFAQLNGRPAGRPTLCVEVPCHDPERPFWPVPTRASALLADRYRLEASQTARVHFCGRLGTYRYVNLDQAVAQALHLSQQLLAAVPSPEVF